MVPKEKFNLMKIITWVLFLGTILLFGFYMLFNNKIGSENLVTESITQTVFVSEVPYYGRLGKVSPHEAINYPAESVLLSVYDYWYPEFYTATSVAEKIPNNRVSFEFWTEYIDQDRFSVSIDYLDLLDVQVLLGPSSRTPLITQLPLTPDQPTNLTTFLPVVVVGVSPEGVLVHDFWRGQALLIPLDEFTRLQNRLPEPLKNRYLVITPKDSGVRQSKLSKTDTAYERSPKLDELHDVLSLLALGELAEYEYQDQTHPEVYRYYKEISTRSDFTKLPRPFQTLSLLRVGAYLYDEGLIDEALPILLEANSLNYGFSEPYEDWFPGFALVTGSGAVLDSGFRTPLLLAKIYESKENLSEARKYVAQAAELVPQNTEVLAVQARITNQE